MACFEEKLIAVVRKYDFIYNPKRKKYKKVKKKEAAWEKISEEIGSSAEVCKDKWRYLRNQFIREKNRKEESSINSANDPHQWKFYCSLKFLLPTLKPRKNYPKYASQRNIEVSSSSNTQCEENTLSPVKSISPLPTSRKRAHTPENPALQTLANISAAIGNNFNASEDENDLFFEEMKKKMKPLSMRAKNRIQEVILAKINKEVSLAAAEMQLSKKCR